jgi:hypothetical protein
MLCTLAGPFVLPSVAVRTGGQARGDEELIAAQPVRDRVLNLCADPLVPHQLGDLQLTAFLDPAQVLRREIAPVVAEQVQPGPLEGLDCGHVDRDDQPTPQLAQFALGVAEGTLTSSAAPAWPTARTASATTAATSGSREDAEVRAIGDPPSADRASHGWQQVGALVERERSRGHGRTAPRSPGRARNQGPSQAHDADT